MNLIPNHGFRERCATCQARASCPFAGLPSGIVKQFHAIGQVKLYSQDDTLFRQGEEASGLFIIRSGWVKLFHLTAAGKITTLGLVGPGGTLGLIEILTEDQHEVSAETLEESRLDYVAKEKFNHFLFENPVVAVRLLKKVSHEMQKFLTELYQMAGKVPSDERLLHTLQDLSETCGHPTGDGIKLKLSFTVQDLADRIGCSRQWASRLLSNLQTQGLIQRKGGWITLTPQALKDRCSVRAVPTIPNA